MKIPHVAVYTRVSTTDQAEDGLSLDAQCAQCLAFLAKSFGPNQFTYEFFSDPGRSGAKGPKPWATSRSRGDRAGLWDLIQKVKAGEFTHVIAFRVDRIYRDHLSFGILKREVLRPAGVELLLVTLLGSAV